MNKFLLCLAVSSLTLLTGTSAQAQAPAAPPAQAAQMSPQNQAADKAYRSGDFKQVIAITTQTLASNPKDDIAYYLRASAKVEMAIRGQDAKLLREGLTDARQSIAALGKPKAEYYLPYLYGMTHLTMIEGVLDHAQTTVNVATKVIEQLANPQQEGLAPLTNEQKANLLFQRGLARLQCEDTVDAAIADFEEAVKTFPAHMGALMAIADAYVMAGETDLALESFEIILRKYPNESLIYNNRGMFLQQNGEYEKAIADFTKAVQINPSFAVAYVNRGYSLLELDRLAAAESDLTKALELEPNQPPVLQFRAGARLRQGKSQEAIADYQQALKLMPQNPLPYADLGFVYYFMHEYKSAAAAFAKAAEVGGEEFRFLNPWRYASLILSGQGQETVTLFQPVIDKAEEDRDWIDFLTLFLMGKVDQGTLLSKINKEDQFAQSAQTCEAHYFIGQRISNLGKTEEATEHYRQSLATQAKQLSAFRGAQYELKQFDNGQ